MSEYFDTKTDAKLVTVEFPNEKMLSNLKFVCEMLDRARKKFGVFIVTSGLRKATGSKSNHPKGECIDFVPTESSIKDVFEWIRWNLVYDQVILEKNKEGNEWIHYSIKKDGGNRKMALIGYWDEGTKQMEYKSA